LSYPDYTYNYSGKRSDPVNVVFKQSNTQEISNFLKNRGWSDTTGGDQYLKLNNQRRINDAQLAKGSFWRTRFHLRLWNVNQDCIGSIHYERYELIGHNVYHFEGAERRLSSDFEATGGWSVNSNGPNLNQVVYEKYNDGKITEISKN